MIRRKRTQAARRHELKMASKSQEFLAFLTNGTTFGTSVQPKNSSSHATYEKNLKKALEISTLSILKPEFSDICSEPEPREKDLYKGLIVPCEKKDDDFLKSVEYQCDDEDFLFLKTMSSKSKNKSSSISVSDLEAVIDRLEKECIFTVSVSSGPGLTIGMDADDVCTICCDGDVTNTNQIIYCDMCNVAVHQECYGVPYIPEGQWLCRRCSLHPGKSVQCCLCPNSGGAYKQTTDGRWAHVICAVWINECHFLNPVFAEPIEGVDNALHERRKLKCLVCRQKGGACIQCSARQCVKAFHITCAQEAGLVMKWVPEKDNSEEGFDVKRYIYCHLHAEEDDDIKDAMARKKRMQAAIRNARKSISARLDDVPEITMPKVSDRTLKNIRKDYKCDVDTICAYWYLKRKSRCGVPLIKRLLTSHKLSPRVRLDDDDVTEQEKKLHEYGTVIRRNMETERMLAELVLKREKNKREHLRTSQALFNLVFEGHLHKALLQVVDKLKMEDDEKIFWKPVTIEGYKLVIKRPMDLSTMRKNIIDSKYKSIADLRADFNLMMNNCSKFNHDNTWFLKYGRNMKKIGAEIFEDAEKQAPTGEVDFKAASSVNEIADIMFYSSLGSDSEEDIENYASEKEQESVKSPPRKHPKLSFLQSPTTSEALKSSRLKNSPRMKRKLDDSPAIFGAKKTKVSADESSSQTTLDRFFSSPKTSSWTSERRSRSSQLTTPLMDFRDNSVTSPLAGDAISSESSADEEDVRPGRRSARLGLNVGVADENKAETKDGFFHNALVVVDGIAGRVLDPSYIYLEEVPNSLLNECRRRNSHNDSVLVMQFGTENKWSWCCPSKVRVFDPAGDCSGISKPSLDLARKWYRKVVEQGGNR